MVTTPSRTCCSSAARRLPGRGADMGAFRATGRAACPVQLAACSRGPPSPAAVLVVSLLSPSAQFATPPPAASPPAAAAAAPLAVSPLTRSSFSCACAWSLPAPAFLPLSSPPNQLPTALRNDMRAPLEKVCGLHVCHWRGKGLCHSRHPANYTAAKGPRGAARLLRRGPGTPR